MANKIFPLIIVALLVLPRAQALVGYLTPSNTPDAPKPTNTFGLDTTLPALFAGQQANAQRVAGLCDGLADRIEADGKRQTPRIKYTVTIDDLRLAALDVMLDGKKLGEKYPTFGSTVEPVFKAEFPTGEIPLSPEKRAKACEIFRAIAWACRQAPAGK